MFSGLPDLTAIGNPQPYITLTRRLERAARASLLMSTIFALPVARHGIQAQLIEESSLHFREACIAGEQLPRICQREIKPERQPGI